MTQTRHVEYFSYRANEGNSGVGTVMVELYGERRRVTCYKSGRKVIVNCLRGKRLYTDNPKPPIYDATIWSWHTMDTVYLGSIKSGTLSYMPSQVKLWFREV